MHPIDRIPPLAAGSNGHVHVVIDTPRGSRNKVKWDDKLGVFTLSHVLSPGAVFPCDFGFIPGTNAADGDALDVLVLADEPLFSGCLLVARLIGGIEAEQSQDGKTFRNDRLLAVAAASRTYEGVHDLADVPKNRLDEIEQFFVDYNRLRGRKFKPRRRLQAPQAMDVVKAGVANAKKSRPGKARSR
jgi:inorganic pyrophosphatase